MKGTVIFTKCIQTMRTFQLMSIKKSLELSIEHEQDDLRERQLEILNEELRLRVREKDGS